MSIIRNIQNNIVVIYEIKYFYVILPEKLFLNNILRANYHFTNSKKIKKTIILPHYCLVQITSLQIVKNKKNR
jgi:hypothetical protein